MNAPKQDPLTARIADTLSERVRDMDGRTCSRLRQARAHAIEQGLHRRHLFPWRQWLLPVALAASVAVITLGLLQQQPASSPTVEQLAQAEIEALIDEIGPGLDEDIAFNDFNDFNGGMDLH